MHATGECLLVLCYIFVIWGCSIQWMVSFWTIPNSSLLNDWSENHLLHSSFWGTMTNPTLIEWVSCSKVCPVTEAKIRAAQNQQQVHAQQLSSKSLILGKLGVLFLRAGWVSEREGSSGVPVLKIGEDWNEPKSRICTQLLTTPAGCMHSAQLLGSLSPGVQVQPRAWGGGPGSLQSFFN